MHKKTNEMVLAKPEEELLESELESELELELPSSSPVRVGTGGGAVFSHSLSSSVK